jgi:hypothetical protein
VARLRHVTRFSPLVISAALKTIVNAFETPILLKFVVLCFIVFLCASPSSELVVFDPWYVALSD